MAWDDIFGQAVAKRLLQDHLAAGCVAGAYLLVGPDGVGKRLLALEAVKALNCLGEGPRPCERCSACAQAGRGVHPDIHVLLPGGASLQVKIDDVKRLLSRLALRPFSGAVQVAIIDGAERLTEEAANALLKTLEEPSMRAHFFLTTARVSDCLPTITSRCQLIRCAGLRHEDVCRILTARSGCTPPVAEAIARLSHGSAAAALAMAQRWGVSAALRKQLADERLSTWLAQPLPETRQELADCLEEMIGWLRDVAVASVAGLERVTRTMCAQEIARHVERLPWDRCLETAFELLRLRESLEQFVNPRLVASLAREKWLSLTTVQC